MSHYCQKTKQGASQRPRTDTPSLTSHDAGHSPAGWTQAAPLWWASHWRLSLIFFLVWALEVIYAFLLLERFGDNSSNTQCLLRSKCLRHKWKQSTARMTRSHTHTQREHACRDVLCCPQAHTLQSALRRIYKCIAARAEPFRYYSPLITPKNALVNTNLRLFVFFSSLWSKWVSNVNTACVTGQHRAQSNIKCPFPLRHNSSWSLLPDSTEGQTTFDDVDSGNTLFHCWTQTEMWVVNF